MEPMIRYDEGIASEITDNFPPRGENFRMAACPERVRLAMPKRFANVAGVILESDRIPDRQSLQENLLA